MNKVCAFLISGILFLGGFAGLSALGDQSTKIAVASQGNTVEAQVAKQGARCAWLMFFDAEGTLMETLENPYQQASGAAGAQCAAFLADKGATVFAAGNVGNRMAGELERLNIEFVSITGTVKDAVTYILNR